MLKKCMDTVVLLNRTPNNAEAASIDDIGTDAVLPKIQTISALTCAASVCTLLASCGGDDPEPPVANSLTITTTEDSAISNKVTATSPEGDPLTFQIAEMPSHGNVNINPNTGEFTYSPEQDYFGEDTFTFEARANRLLSEQQSVRITITPVNDPPALRAIPALANSAETRVLEYKLPVTDVDGDALQITATSEDPTVATVSVDADNLAINISPVARGATRVQVTVRDAEFSSSQTFDFGVGDVTKWRNVAANMANGEAIEFSNTTDQFIPLTFVHNGFPLFQSDEEMAQYVIEMPKEFPGEPFERKLWRFVRDNTYHSVPLTGDLWLHDPWAVINSGGWGFCSHVSATYVRIARAASYEARVWGLTGHVVPEIRVSDRWQMFDPDLSVYYFDRDRKPAGVEQLSNDPALITAPVDAIFSGSNYIYPYSAEVADYYGTTASNFVGLDRDWIARTPAKYQPLILPPGASITYPGRWTPTLWGVDGTTPQEVPHYLQASLVLPSGSSGPVVLPWMIWEIRGNGRVNIFDAEYDIGSPELVALLQSPGKQIAEILLVSSTTDVQFIFFINGMRYTLNPANKISIRGKDVWGIGIRTITLPAEAHAPADRAAIYKKPVS